MTGPSTEESAGFDDRAGAEEGSAAGRRTHAAPGAWAMTDAGWSHPLAAPQGDLAEWSCDAVGWLAATVADSAAQLGIHTPVLFTVLQG